MASTFLQITHVGGPTAIIEFGGARFLTDPTFDPSGGEYTTGPVTLRKSMGPALTASQVGSIDFVLLSHDHHADNLDRAGRAMLSSAGTVLTTEAGAQRLGGNSLGLKPWQSIDVSTRNGIALRVTATPARHGPADHDRGPVIGFAVSRAEAPDQCFYFAGDTVWYEGVAEVAQQLAPRVAILNLGAARVPEVGPFHLTMTATEAAEAAHAFGTAPIVPLHFEGWAHFSEGREQIAKAFADAGLSTRLVWPKPGEAVRVNL